ncbi:hypothetical protein CYMTET_4596 [Cymbomonas tetramitiformis]|uniref:Uncharacterized protein n=1 Tax=Cymbomonas tetramitiformis TaxID=36881 RepID=A0AAE0H122_9CHLO|nr:hypothetical protein CYMTET_4596 [Cymbomonas tetramitiformis]
MAGVPPHAQGQFPPQLMQQCNPSGAPGLPPPPPYPPPNSYQAGGNFGSGYAGGYNAGYGGNWAGQRPPSKFNELQEQLVSARMEKLSAELKLDNEKALREKDRELEDVKAAIEKKKKKEKEKEKKKKKRKSKADLSSSDDSTSSESEIGTPEEDQRRRQKERKEKQREERRRGREELRQQRDRMDAMAKQLDLMYETNRNLMAAGAQGFGHRFPGSSPMTAAVSVGRSGRSGAASTGPKKKQQRRRPVVSEDEDEGEDEEEKNEESVQQTEEDVRERFKAAAGTKRMVDVLKATKKYPANWDKAQPNRGMTRPAIVKHIHNNGELDLMDF